MPAGEDAVSAVSELKVLEWLEELGGEAPPLFFSMPDIMASAGEG